MQTVQKISITYGASPNLAGFSFRSLLTAAIVSMAFLSNFVSTQSFSGEVPRSTTVLETTITIGAIRRKMASKASAGNLRSKSLSFPSRFNGQVQSMRRKKAFVARPSDVVAGGGDGEWW